MARYKVKDVNNYLYYSNMDLKIAFVGEETRVYEEDQLSDFFLAKAEGELVSRDKHNVKEMVLSLALCAALGGYLYYVYSNERNDFFEKYIQTIFAAPLLVLSGLNSLRELIPYVKKTIAMNDYLRLSKLSESHRFKSYVKRNYE